MPYAPREEPPGERALAVPVGTDWYGLDLAAVQVVVEAPRVARVPGAPPRLLGVTNVRGEVVPVLDTGLAVGVGAAGPVRHAVVVHTPAGAVALASDGTPRAVQLTDDLGPSDLPAGGARRRAGDLVVTMLEPGRLA